ncbi:MAG: DUF3846 domain-containing protein, partial [Agathobacter sp.]
EINYKQLKHTTMSKMIEIYKMLKDKHSDALILFRVGDFYESYCDDAQKASEVLGVTLTKRKDGLYITGFPHHALDTYLPKLIRAGVRVAICDDISEPVMLKHRGSDETTAPIVEDADDEEIKTEEPQQEEEEPTETRTAKIVYPDKDSEDYSPKNGRTFELEEMQKIVGGYIEIVHLNDGRLMIVNEEGLLHGLPVNIEATNILRRYHSTTQYIVGNAIVCDSYMIE